MSADFSERHTKWVLGCIAVSKFRTESGDEIVSTETKVGEEEIITSKTWQQRTSRTSIWSGDKPVDQVTWEAVEEFTARAGDPNATFTLKNIEQVVSEKYPDLAKSDSVRNRIRGKLC